MSHHSLNEIYTRLTMSRRYEVWFLKLMLSDGSGAWWIRYLLMNLGHKGEGGCPTGHNGMPVQVWATWFPINGEPLSVIQGFSKEGLSLNNQPFQLSHDTNRIGENSCAGLVEADGHTVSWNLHYRSTLSSTMSDVRWVGFSRTPHSDAIFSGEIQFDGRSFSGELLGYGLQGHNCGYRHRHMWTWTHLLSLDPNRPSTTFEALEYDIGAGLMFRKALLWHEGTLYKVKRFSNLFRSRNSMQWRFTGFDPHNHLQVEVSVDGRGPSLHRLPYTKTDCSGTFEVSNNSLATGTLSMIRDHKTEEQIPVNGGAVLEIVGGE